MCLKNEAAQIEQLSLNSRPQHFIDIIMSREEWVGFLKVLSDIGMCTLIYMHEEDSALRRRSVVYLPILGVFAQLLTPCLLLWNAVGVGQDFCPHNANVLSRLVALAIGCIYQCRIGFKVRSWFSINKGAVEVERPRNTFLLRFALQFDWFMSTWYELIVYYLNILIVFFTSDPLSMVLNCLSLEFIMKLDDDVKGVYIEVFDGDQDIVESYQAVFGFGLEDGRPGEPGNPCTCSSCCLDDIRQIQLNEDLLLINNIILPFLTKWWLPLCKPA